MSVYALSLLAACALVGAAVTTADRAAPRGDALTPAQAYECVHAHNAWRQRVGALSLRWSPDLADRAQLRADVLSGQGCVIVHGPLPRDVGENLFYASALRRAGGRADEIVAVTATQVVDEWGAESADYSAAHDTCVWNRQCGHYTQIVWATTREVGCAMSVCPSLGQIWVCNYRPRGNVRMVR